MKTFLDSVCRQEILTRIKNLAPSNKRRWGRMNVQQMVCHLSDSTRIILGEKRVEFLGNTFTRSRFYRWMAFNPLPWPRGILKTAPEIDQLVGGTKPATFEADKKELLRLLHEFSARSTQTQWPEHPLFGECGVEDWGKQVYRHCDHHLTQFSA